MKRKRTRRVKGKLGVGRQRGGKSALLAAMMPALTAGASMGVLGKYATQKAIQAIEKKKYKRKTSARPS